VVSNGIVDIFCSLELPDYTNTILKSTHKDSFLISFAKQGKDECAKKLYT